MSYWKTLAIVYITSFALIQLIFWLLKQYSSGHRFSNLARLHHVVNFEYYMLIGSVFIWKRVIALCHPPDDGSLPQYYRSGAKYSPLSPGGRQIADKPSKMTPGQKNTLRIVALVTATILLLAQICHIFYYYPFLNSSGNPNFIIFISFVCFGLYMHYVIFMLGASLVNFVVRYAISTSLGQNYIKPILLKLPALYDLLLNSRLQTFLVIVFGTLIGFFSLYAGQQRITPEEVTIKIKDLPQEFQRFKIALLSDVHLGPAIGKDKMQEAVDLINSLGVDVVALNGDLVDGTVEDLSPLVAPLKQLKPTLGSYFVTGNHEYYYGNVDEWMTHLSSLGINLLHNNHTKLYHNTKTDPNHHKTDEPYICLAGVDDLSSEGFAIPGHGMAVRQAVDGCGKSMPVILLSHNPTGAKVAFDLKPALPRLDLVLSGHNHGGQLYVYAPVMYMKSLYFSGLYKVAPDHQVYVGPGAYYWAAPMKMYGLVKVSVIVLQKQ